jgi:hypothetical protein
LANENVIKNTTIELTHLEMLCDNNQTMSSIRQNVIDLYNEFEKCKSKFSANDRRLLRQRFVQLAARCQKQNASKDIVSFAIELADHAYKLPERMEE